MSRKQQKPTTIEVKDTHFQMRVTKEAANLNHATFQFAQGDVLFTLGEAVHLRERLTLLIENTTNYERVENTMLNLYVTFTAEQRDVILFSLKSDQLYVGSDSKVKAFTQLVSELPKDIYNDICDSLISYFSSEINDNSLVVA